jgi:hypothetical protein
LVIFYGDVDIFLAYAIALFIDLKKVTLRTRASFRFGIDAKGVSAIIVSVLITAIAIYAVGCLVSAWQARHHLGGPIISLPTGCASSSPSNDGPYFSYLLTLTLYPENSFFIDALIAE